MPGTTAHGIDGVQRYEIVVTGDCILIGHHFCSSEKNVGIKTHPDWIEFHFTIVKRHGSPMHLNLRVPLAPGGQPEADRIAQEYQRVYAILAARFSGPLIKVYLFLGFVCGIAALTGLVALVAHVLQLTP